MSNHPITAVAAAIALAAAPRAMAFSISVADTGSGLYYPGDTVELVVMFDFIDDPTIGGGIDLFWDPTAFVAGSWLHGGLGLPKFALDPVFGPGEAIGAGIGDFEGLAQGLYGTLSLEVASGVAPGQYSITLAENMGVAGPFFSAQTFQQYPPGSIDLGSATVSLDVNAFDPDGDGVAEKQDNCREVANPDQRDTDADGIGNACDADLDNDCTVSFGDLASFKAVFLTGDPDADFDGDGVVTFGDLALMRQSFSGAPGPAAFPSLCVVAEQSFGDGSTPRSGGWTTGFSGSVVSSAGDLGGSDHILEYTAGSAGGLNGFHLHTRESGSGFLGDYAATGATNIEFRARHSGIGDDVILRAVVFDDFANGEDWAVGTTAVTIPASATSWQQYALSLREADLIAGGFNGVSVADVLADVHHIGLRHDPSGSGPGNPSPVANPTTVQFDDLALTVGPLP